MNWKKYKIDYDDDFENGKNDDYIELQKGHNSGGCFWVMPVKINFYYPNKKGRNYDYFDDVFEYRSFEISIFDLDVDICLLYFLLKHFNEKSKENKFRKKLDDKGFNYYLEHNFYTYKSVKNMLVDIKETVDILENSNTKEMAEKLLNERFEVVSHYDYYKRKLSKEIFENNVYSVEAIIDFYKRFITTIEDMMSKCKDTDVISFMGP